VRSRLPRLCQALFALVTNAREASEEPGEIMIEGRRVEAGVAIAVEDDGPGIDEGVRARIFEPFFTTRDPARHPGLGLTVARLLLAPDGGEVAIETPRRLQGARVVLRLEEWTARRGDKEG
jgi:signal transduction histidine kinase